MNIGIAKKPLSGYTSCGDEGCYWVDQERVVLCVIDGLGHGREAEQAAQMAKEYLRINHKNNLIDIFQGCDRQLIHSRGVAMGMAVVDRGADIVTYVGVGNIRAMLCSHKIHRFSCNYGIVGGGFKALKSQTLPLIDGDRIILYSDGVQEVIDMSNYSNALLSNCQAAADILLQDWSTQRDDAVVLVYQHRAL